MVLVIIKFFNGSSKGRDFMTIVTSAGGFLLGDSGWEAAIGAFVI